MSQTRFTLHDVLCHFEELEDARSEINGIHPLGSVIVIAQMNSDSCKANVGFRHDDEFTG